MTELVRGRAVVEAAEPVRVFSREQAAALDITGPVSGDVLWDTHLTQGASWRNPAPAATRSNDCGPTMAVVAQRLLGADRTGGAAPAEAVTAARELAAMEPGRGANLPAVERMLGAADVPVERSKAKLSRIERALDDQHMVLAAGMPGDAWAGPLDAFVAGQRSAAASGSNGHWVLLAGRDESGRVVVLDPGFPDLFLTTPEHVRAFVDSLPMSGMAEVG